MQRIDRIQSKRTLVQGYRAFMPNWEIAGRRLYQQQLSRPTFAQPEQVVSWLGAVQAQEYAPTLWSIGQRMTNAQEADIESAVNEGRILRTHLLRPTWHFVARQDIRWLLQVSAARVHALNATMVRQVELDEAILRRSSDVIAQALQGGQQRTREELGQVLHSAGIVATGVRLAYIMMFAELEAVVCSGARQGKHFTYALLEERAPDAKTLTHDEALAELVKRYFISHGPATLKDFTWWSSLTLADARAGVALLDTQLASETVDGQTFWFDPAAQLTTLPPPAQPQVHLLPIYDEYISYADRSHIFVQEYKGLHNPQYNLSYPHLIVIDGQIVGTWKRTLRKKQVAFQYKPFRPLTPIEEESIRAQAQRFGDFLGMSVVFE